MLTLIYNKLCSLSLHGINAYRASVHAYQAVGCGSREPGLSRNGMNVSTQAKHNPAAAATFTGYVHARNPQTRTAA